MTERTPVCVEVHETQWAPFRARIATRPKQPPIGVRIVCSAASFIVQALAVVYMFDVTPVTREDPRRVSAGVAQPRHGDSIEPLTVVFLDEVASGVDPWPEPPALSAMSLPGVIDLRILDVSVPRMHFGELETMAETARSMEPVAVPGADRLQLFELYVGQIKARIERAWEHGDASESQCLAHITQDRSGAVSEVKLPGCTADPEWQASVVTAIRRASPLPAPPVAQVFSEHLTLELGIGR